MKLTKEYYKWTYEEDFSVPEGVYEAFKEATDELGVKKEQQWNELFSQYESEHAEFANQLKSAIQGEMPEGLQEALPTYEAGSSHATRSASGDAINAIANVLPSFFGGSADLAGSNKTTIKGAGDFLPGDYTGRNIWFGVREFAMGTALNGMALHGGLHVFGGTFFVFSDYVRPAIRLSALMGMPVTYVFTHDSVAVGEDGPTHEPVEHLSSLRSMPGLTVIRPADGNETSAAWNIAITSKNRPTVLVLSRQNLDVLPKSGELAMDGVRRGAYTISPADKEVADGIIIATGSEVNLAVAAQTKLLQKALMLLLSQCHHGICSTSRMKQYKESVLPKAVKKRLSIEMGASLGWHKYVGDEGGVMAIDTFGASAPGEKVIAEYGFTEENVIREMKMILDRN